MPYPTGSRSVIIDGELPAQKRIVVSYWDIFSMIIFPN